MNISLVFVPTPTNAASAESPSVDNQGGVFPPLQLMYVASILENGGHKVQILDANADSLSKELAYAKIKKFKTNMIGFSSGVVQWREVLSWATYFRSRSKIRTVVGGPIILDYAKEVLSHSCIDYAVYGFRNETILELLDAMKTGRDLSEIEGLCFRKDGVFHHVPFTDQKYGYKDLNRLPRPARHLVPNHKYFEFYTRKKNFTLMLTSTGCPYHCAFCGSRYQKFTERPLSDVMDEISEIYDKFGIREIDFKDNTFTLKKERVLEFCSQLRKRGLHNKIRWSCMTRVDRVDDEILRTMSENGCIHIKYGIETGSQRMLNYLSKGITLDRIKLAIYLTKKYKMEAYGFFQFGAPGETLVSAGETTRFALNMCRGIYPDSPEKTEDAEKEALCYDCPLASYKTAPDFDMWAQWVKDKDYELPIRAIGTKLKDDEILDIINSTYKGFYLSPYYAFKQLSNMSMVMLTKGSLAALSILTGGLSYKVMTGIRSGINWLKIVLYTY
jgi:radical SAM superfamily enzyme YgiQ (UPF0313 family)